MRIGFISTVQGHQWPGSEYLWSACAEKLLQLRHEVFVCASSDLRGAPALEKLKDCGAVIDLVPSRTGRAGRIREKILNPFRRLSNRRLDLLVVSSGSPYDPAYRMPIGRFLCETGIPLVMICHFNAETFWVNEHMRNIMAQIFQKAAATVFVSRDNQRLTERQLGVAIPRANVIVPPLCLDLPEPLPWPDEENGERVHLACVARLEPQWKGQDLLFEVLADPKWQGRNFVLNLFGEGAEVEYLKRLSNFYGLNEKIVFAGLAKPEAIWSRHHLQVLATRGEGGPMVITEGMMCGRVAVTTRCGFSEDYVRDGVTGFLAESATPGCFGAKLEEAWQRRDDWQRMGLAAHRLIRQRMGDFNAPERLLELLVRKN